MSTLQNQNFSRHHNFQKEVSLAEIPLHKPTSDTISATFTQFFTIAGVPWRYAIRKVDKGQAVANVLEFELHCHCDARSFFMIDVRSRVTIIRPERDEFSRSKTQNFALDWKTKVYQFEDFEEIPYLLDPDNNWLVGEEKIRVEFDTRVLGATSAALPIPRFSPEVEYHDICIQTPKKDFYVSTMILKERLRFHKRILVRKTGNLIDLRRQVKTWEFFEFLKLVYLYQDDISVINFESSLKLAKRYGADGVVFMLEKFVLRTEQLHTIEKMMMANKYGLDHVMNMAIRLINTTQLFDEYTALSPTFRDLPSAIRYEIKDQLHEDNYRMYENPDLKIQISEETLPLEDELYTSDKEEFRGMEMSATLEQELLDGVMGYRLKVYCQGPSREEYYLARMKLVAHYDYLAPPGGTARYKVDTDALYTPSHPFAEMRILPYDLNFEVQRHFNMVIHVSLTELHVSSNFTRSRNVDFRDDKRLSNATLEYEGVTYHVIKEILAASSGVFEALFRGSYRKRKGVYRMETLRLDNFEEGLQHLWHGARTFSPRGFYDIMNFTEKIGSARLSEELDLWSCRRWPEANQENYDFARENAFQSMLLTTAHEMFGTAGVRQIGELQPGPVNGQPAVINREADQPFRRAIAAERATPPLDPEEEAALAARAADAPGAQEAQEAPEEPRPEAAVAQAPERNIFAENIAVPEALNPLAELLMPPPEFPDPPEAQRQADHHVHQAIQEIRAIRDPPPPPLPPMNAVQQVLADMAGVGGGGLENMILQGVRRAFDRPVLQNWRAPEGLLAPNDLIQMQQLLEGLVNPDQNHFLNQPPPPQFPVPFPGLPAPPPFQGPFPGLPGQGPFPVLPPDHQGQAPDPNPGPNLGPDGFPVPQDPDGM